MKDRLGVFRVWLGNSEGKTPLGRHSCRNNDNIKDFQILRYVSMDCIELAQDRYRWHVLVNVMMNLLRFRLKRGIS